MDPLTAAFNALTAALTLGTKIWDATPKELQSQSAGDWAKSFHDISAFFLSVQDKINQTVKNGIATP